MLSEIAEEKIARLSQFLADNNLQIEFPDYSSADYWNKRYLNEKGKTYEWLQNYESLRPFLLGRLKEHYDCEILQIGCGNSKFSECLYKDGYKNITNIDISYIVIQEMSEKYRKYEEMDFQTMDVTNLDIQDCCFDFILDKGTLDCLFTSERAANDKIYRALAGLHRVLKIKGELLIISIGHPDVRLPYLKQKGLNWNIQVFELDKPTTPLIDGLEDNKYHYLYICTKTK